MPPEITPQEWEAFAAKFGEDQALQYLGERPTATASNRPGVVEGMARGAAQGATLGLADEGLGALAGAGAVWPGGRSPGEAFRETVDSERRQIEEFSEDHPVLAFGSEMVGGAVTGAGAGTLARKAGIGGGKAAATSLRRLLGTSAAGGGAAGAGMAEGDLTSKEGLRSRVGGAAKGAAAGLAFGAGMRGLGTGAGVITGRALDATGLRPRNASGPVGATATRAGIESADDRATRKVLEAARRDDLVEETPEGLSFERLVEARRSAEGKPVSILDLGDEEGNLIGLGRATKTLPGKAKKELSEKFTERSAGRRVGGGRREGGELRRVTDDLETGVGFRREGVGDIADDIIARRAENFGPMFEETFKRTPVVDDPRVAKLLTSDRESIRRGIRAAQRIAREEGRQAFTDANAIGSRDLHYLKLGLDDVLGQMRRTGQSGGSKGTLFGKMMKTKEELLGLMDENLPGYADARQGYAGESALRDALEEGANDFLSASDDEVRRRLATMTEGEREMYRRGGLDSVIRNLRRRTDESSQSRALNRSPESRDKIRFLFDDPDEADAFLDRLELEERMGHTKNKLLEGSRTAEVQTEQADLTEVPRFPTGMPSKAGVLRAILNPVADQLEGRARGFSGKISEELADRFTAGLDDPRDLDRLIETLRLYAEEQAAKRAGANQRLGGAAAVAGGRAVNLPGGN